MQILRAKDLANKDGLGSGVSDPYAILTVGAATAPRTPTIRDNVNPVWNMHFDFPIEVIGFLDGGQIFIYLSFRLLTARNCSLSSMTTTTRTTSSLDEPRFRLALLR